MGKGLKLFTPEREKRYIINSKPFRRLADKTQVVPNIQRETEMEKFQRNSQIRTRLTHSLEVASISHEIALNIKNIKTKWNNNYHINPIICENASLLHDVAMSGFGHVAETLLNKVFGKRFGVFYEANASNLILIEKDLPELSDLTIVSTIKYPYKFKNKLNGKGLYKKHYKKYIPILNDIIEIQNGNNPIKRTRTFECDIMEIADDISYLFSDLVDMLYFQYKMGDERIKSNVILDLIKKHKITDPNIYIYLKEILLNNNLDKLEELRDLVILNVKYSKRENKILLESKEYNKLLLLLREITWVYYIKKYSITTEDALSKKVEEYFLFLANNIDNTILIEKNILSNTRQKQYKKAIRKGQKKKAIKYLVISLSELTDTYLYQQLNLYLKNKK